MQQASLLARACVGVDTALAAHQSMIVSTIQQHHKPIATLIDHLMMLLMMLMMLLLLL
jgi:hypothetical protein